MDDQWQVTGNAAETYERALVPAVFAPWAPHVVALADPQTGERVLDIACGTGLIARLAAERVGRTGNVTGLDLNPGMLSFAASITSPDPATSAPITWREASATNMPLSLTQHSMLCTVSWDSNSFPIGRPRCAKCIACWCPAVAWDSWCGRAFNTVPGSVL